MSCLIKRILTISLVLGFIFYFYLPKEVFAQKKGLDSQKELRQEIQILNLINGLYLSSAQMEFLIKQAKKTQELRENFLEEYQKYSDELNEILKELKGELIENTAEVSEDIAKKVHQLNHKILKLKVDYEEEMDNIIQQVKNNLSGNQIYIIEEFKPCLIPPKGPLRVGQAGSSKAGLKQLERIREIPEHIYSVKKDEIAGRFLEKILLYKPKGQEIDEEEARNKILSIFDEARALSDLDFELKKEKLAAQLKEDILPEIKTIDVDTKIEHFLLNPSVIPILEEKIENKED